MKTLFNFLKKHKDSAITLIVDKSTDFRIGGYLGNSKDQMRFTCDKNSLYGEESIQYQIQKMVQECHDKQDWKAFQENYYKWLKEKPAVLKRFVHAAYHLLENSDEETFINFINHHPDIEIIPSYENINKK